MAGRGEHGITRAPISRVSGLTNGRSITIPEAFPKEDVV